MGGQNVILEVISRDYVSGGRVSYYHNILTVSPGLTGGANLPGGFPYNLYKKRNANHLSVLNYSLLIPLGSENMKIVGTLASVSEKDR